MSVRFVDIEKNTKTIHFKYRKLKRRCRILYGTESVPKRVLMCIHFWYLIFHLNYSSSLRVTRLPETPYTLLVLRFCLTTEDLTREVPRQEFY